MQYTCKYASFYHWDTSDMTTAGRTDVTGG